MGVSPRVATFQIGNDQNGCISKNSYLSNRSPFSTWRNSNGCLAQHLCVPLKLEMLSHLLGWPILHSKKHHQHRKSVKRPLQWPTEKNIFPLPIIIIPIQNYTCIDPRWHTTMAPCNGTTSTPPKLVVTLPNYNGTLQWHHVPQSWSSTPPPLQWHPAVAPRPLPQSWPSPSPSLLAHYNGTSPSPTIAHYNGTLRWHPAMAPRPLHPAMAPWCHVQIRQSGSSPSPLIGSKNPYSYRYLGNNGTLQWHPGALSTPAKLAHHRLPPQHTTMAPCNRCHVQSAKVGPPSPP